MMAKLMCWMAIGLCRVFGTSMVEEYEEISESQFPSDRSEDLDEDYGELVGRGTGVSQSKPLVI